VRTQEQDVDDTDRLHLRRCVDLAREALEAGDEPFGSVLVTADGRVGHEDRNHVGGGDATRHPELAHAWVGLGRIVYASSSAQLAAWRAELGAPPSPVRDLPIGEIAPGVPVAGPVAGLDEEVRDLHRRLLDAAGGQSPAGS
jgi:hypothetical protein